MASNTYQYLLSICKCRNGGDREQQNRCAFVLHRCEMDTPENRKAWADLQHEHEWGPWLVEPYFPTHLMRQCPCGEEETQPVEGVKVIMVDNHDFNGFSVKRGLPTGDQRVVTPNLDEILESIKPALFSHLVTLAQAMTHVLTKEQIIVLMREAIDELEKEE